MEQFMTSPGLPGQRITGAGLAVRIAAFMILGIPLVAFVWEMLNQAFAGHDVLRHLLLAIPGILLLLLFWGLMSRAIQRWDQQLHPVPLPNERREL
jgi:hypothetical protein